MSYLGELRHNVRPLAAASLGTGAGLMLMSYTAIIFGPYLVKEFAWSRSQFALIGLSMFSTLIALPFIGRLTDHFGVRRAAIVGALGIPACLLAYSMMDGNFTAYFLLTCVLLAVGSFSSPVVYTRLIAADFREARGLALTVVTISPALLGAIVVPLLNQVIQAWGWRAGYRALALLVLVFSLCAVALISSQDRAAVTETGHKTTKARADFGLIFKSAPFWIIFAAMALCTLQTPLHSSQMGLMLQDNHLDSAAIAAIISIYGVGTVVGRFACGLALDRFSAPAVAAISMILPAFGYALMASSLDTMVLIGVAMFMIGMTVGAEGDLQSFLVARHFDIRVFSTTLSLVYCGVFAASALGALLISATLKVTGGSFHPFLAAMAVAVFIGSFLFLLLPKQGRFEKIGQKPTGTLDLAAERSPPTLVLDDSEPKQAKPAAAGRIG
jgi:MFS family permease